VRGPGGNVAVGTSNVYGGWYRPYYGYGAVAAGVAAGAAVGAATAYPYYYPPPYYQNVCDPYYYYYNPANCPYPY
jgi:hypothetical protein